MVLTNLDKVTSRHLPIDHHPDVTLTAHFPEYPDLVIYSGNHAVIGINQHDDDLLEHGYHVHHLLNYLGHQLEILGDEIDAESLYEILLSYAGEEFIYPIKRCDQLIRLLYTDLLSAIYQYLSDKMDHDTLVKDLHEIASAELTHEEIKNIISH